MRHYKVRLSGRRRRVAVQEKRSLFRRSIREIESKPGLVRTRGNARATPSLQSFVHI
jgi:hypothetical protein